MRFVLFVGLLMIARAIRPGVLEPHYLFLVVTILCALWLDIDEYLASRGVK